MSFRLKATRRAGSIPLPKRNRRDALVRRIAAAIVSIDQLQHHLTNCPPYMREAYLNELKPYLNQRVLADLEALVVANKEEPSDQASDLSSVSS